MAHPSESVVSIAGSITMADGTTSHFQINDDLTWSQWGADTERLGNSVEVLDAITQGLGQADIHFGEPEPEDDDDEDEDEDDEGRMNAWPESDTAECAAVGEHQPTARHPFSECPTTGDEDSEEGGRSG